MTTTTTPPLRLSLYPDRTKTAHIDSLDEKTGALTLTLNGYGIDVVHLLRRALVEDLKFVDERSTVVRHNPTEDIITVNIIPCSPTTKSATDCFLESLARIDLECSRQIAGVVDAIGKYKS